MKCNAYIMAADPAWIEASVCSYYDLVGRIVVSYDENHLGRTGEPQDTEQCLRRLRAIDREGKFDYRPGHYARPEFFGQPMGNDTHQRQCALRQAGEGADWVLQLDTDEIIGDTRVFADCLQEADRRDRQALNYPSLWLYSRAFGRWYLEWCNRGWRRVPGYPGPMAVRSGSELILSRRVARGHFHVDLTWRGSPNRVPNGALVDRVIDLKEAIWHFAFVRTAARLRRKFASSSHVFDRDWQSEPERWVWAGHHPFLKSLISQFERGPHKRPLRLGKIPLRVQTVLAASAISDVQGE